MILQNHGNMEVRCGYNQRVRPGSVKGLSWVLKEEKEFAWDMGQVEGGSVLWLGKGSMGKFMEVGGSTAYSGIVTAELRQVQNGEKQRMERQKTALRNDELGKPL